MEAAGFIFFLALFAVVGFVSARKGGGDRKDYLLAGQSVSPALIALSAAATKYSGYMFIGLMGYIYLYGLSGVWLGSDDGTGELSVQQLAEIAVFLGSSLAGSTLRSARFMDRYQTAALALHRSGRPFAAPEPEGNLGFVAVLQEALQVA